MSETKSRGSRALEIVLFVLLLASLAAFAWWRWDATNNPERVVITIERQ